MAEKPKVTEMVLILHCSECYKKVKKLLSKFSEIQDQVYDEKNNKVTIKVVGCCPEKVRDKLRCKGRCCIKSIEIPKPKDKTESKDKKESEDEKKPKEKPKSPPPVCLTVTLSCCTICCKGGCKGQCYNPCNCYGRPIIPCGGYCGRSVCDGRCGGVGRGCDCGHPCGGDCRHPWSGRCGGGGYCEHPWSGSYCDSSNCTIT